MAAPCNQVYVADLPDGVDDLQVGNIFGSYGEIVWCKGIPAKMPGKKNAALIEFSTIEEATWFCENLNGNIPEGLTSPIQVHYSVSKEKSEKGKGGKDKSGKVGKDAGKGWGKSKAWDGGKNGKGGYGKADVGKAGGYQMASPYVAPAAPYGAPAGKSGKGGKDAKGGKGGMKGLLKGAIKSGITPWGERPTENQMYVKGLPDDCTDRDLYDLCAPFGAIPPKGVKASQRDGVCTGVGFVDFIETSACVAAIEALNGHEGLMVTQKRSK